MARKTAPQKPPSPRYALIDTLRGTAIMLMVAYHFCFDLNYFGVLHQNFNYSAFWLAARAVIVSLFLLLVGTGSVLSAQHADPQSFKLRMIKLLLAACAVSLGSYLMFPGSYIYFGILHFILVASLIARPFSRFYHLNLLLGTAALTAGLAYSHPLFDLAPLQWIGFMTHKPITEDYVPLFPWIGVVLLGIYAGKFIFMHGREYWLTIAPFEGYLKFPAWLGKHSLAIYLVHQPVMLGILYLALSH